MLNLFFENMSIGVTKEKYFEICEALGEEPEYEHTPPEMDDFPVEIQEVVGIYYKLKDEWDTMNGIYLGKSFAGFADILDILEVRKEDRKYVLEWISFMDSIRAKVYKTMKSTSSKNSSTPTNV